MTGGEPPKNDVRNFENDLHSSIEFLDANHDTRKLTAIMASNQDAAFPEEHISATLSWKGDNSAQNAVYLAIQEQFRYWKQKWQYEEADEQSSEGQSTFNFHLMSTLAVAMDTYWFTESQQVQLFDWLRDMVSGAELEPLKLGNDKLATELSSTKKKIAMMEEKLETMMKYPQGSKSNTVNIPLMVCVVLLAVALGHIITLHAFSK